MKSKIGLFIALLLWGLVSSLAPRDGASFSVDQSWGPAHSESGFSVQREASVCEEVDEDSASSRLEAFPALIWYGQDALVPMPSMPAPLFSPERDGARWIGPVTARVPVFLLSLPPPAPAA